MLMDDFTRPVELAGTDSMRVRRSRAHQTLTLSPAGIRLVRNGKVVTEVAWHRIIWLKPVAVLPRWSTRKEWSIGAVGLPIYPAEFDKQWTTGTIGRWLAHYRPDLELPDDEAARPMPLGVPHRMHPWVLGPGLLIALVVLVVIKASIWTVLALAVIVAVTLLCVTSPRRTRIGGVITIAFAMLPLVFTAVFWLLEVSGGR